MNAMSKWKDYYSCENRTPWFYYRLSDMFKIKKYRNQIQGRELHYKLYPDSLASQYMKETDESYGIDTLINLIRKHCRSLKPQKNELVIHLRVGNVIDNAQHTVKELLEKSRPFWPKGQSSPKLAKWNYFVKPLSFYEKYTNRMDKRIKKTTLVAGGNLTHDRTKSKEYIQAIKKLFERVGLNVRVRLGNPPDDDFVYMCRSEFFIPSGGGFSRLVNDVRACHQQPDLAKTYRARAFSRNKKAKKTKNENNNRNKF